MPKARGGKTHRPSQAEIDTAVKELRSLKRELARRKKANRERGQKAAATRRENQLRDNQNLDLLKEKYETQDGETEEYLKNAPGLENLSGRHVKDGRTLEQYLVDEGMRELEDTWMPGQTPDDVLRERGFGEYARPAAERAEAASKAEEFPPAPEPVLAPQKPVKRRKAKVKMPTRKPTAYEQKVYKEYLRERKK